jgi:hypothetical protein
VGILQFYAPNLLGGEAKAKAIYKYHRVSGYLILTAFLVNVALATHTYYAGKVLGIKTWATVMAGVLVLAGMYYFIISVLWVVMVVKIWLGYDEGG